MLIEKINNLEKRGYLKQKVFVKGRGDTEGADLR